MADINRLRMMAWVPVALMALVACAPGSDPAQTVERDASVEAVPARPVSPEGGAAPEAVELRGTDEGGVEVREADPAAGQGAATAPARTEPPH
ncbi:MAG: hypothetical protein KH046_14055 [Stenotrophomonas maltophilia]|uniref:hypothetical protein n=1 Tax=Stenotrophomonas TaxID=40323 RepID=UPI00131014C5|nr:MULTISPECIES: hypothetical protein [Stenotrophomonas]MBS4801949.1 hypothetical protein [Stenotrophomonas maltophilia]MDG9987326.1 hypothetical protein [Stenotrophomonas sp. GD04024]